MANFMMNNNDARLKSALDTAMHRYLNRFSDSGDGDMFQPAPVAWNCTVLINPKRGQPPGQTGAKAPLPTCNCLYRNKIEAESAVKHAINGILRSSLNTCEPRPPGKRYQRIVRYVKKKKYRTNDDQKVQKPCNDLPKKSEVFKPEDPVCCCPSSRDDRCGKMEKEKPKMGPRAQHLNRLSDPVRRDIKGDLPVPRPVKRSALRFVPSRRIRALAIPRYIQPPPLPCTAIPIRWDPIINRRALTYTASKRILELSQIPDRMLEPEPDYSPITVKKSALRYNATARINYLAMPVQRFIYPSKSQEVNRSALEYRATPRINYLSTPVKRKIVPHNDSRAFAVRKGALKYTLTERTSKLSQPRANYQRRLAKIAPFKVRKTALKYVATERIHQLAFTPWMFPKAIIC